ncbi:MAG: RNA polymerase sporulation sigma factor SigK [Bacilli bacterium]|nr:RNA polymerase sporulation sigma factor SigK [Bacilli bacterium]
MKIIIEFIKKLFIKTSSIFYVGATDILKEPLSKEEEDYYVKLKEEGSIDAKEKLIEHNLRLVVFLAKKYENTNVDLEDLVSIGSIGLIKAINTFSSNKNIKLATYASRCIDNEILMYLRKNKKVKSEVSIDQALTLDSEGNELHLEDIIGTDKDIISKEIEEENDKQVMIKEILSLKPRDREIMILRYGLLGTDEFTQKEVAEKLGISQSYISRIEKKVIKKLKNILNTA